MIESACKVLSTTQPATEAITQALVDALSASLLILPKTDYAEEYRFRIEGFRKMVKEGALLSPKVYEDLGPAYKLVSAGKAWEIPAELKAGGSGKKGIDKAVEICGQLLDRPWPNGRPAGTKRPSAISSPSSSWPSRPWKADLKHADRSPRQTCDFRHDGDD